MPRKKQTGQPSIVRLQALKMMQVTLKIAGVHGPLVCHNWSVKSIREMLEKQMLAKKSTKAREPKDPESEYRQTLYILKGAGKAEEYGFPATAFKNAMVRVVKTLKDTKQLDLDMVLARQALFVLADGEERREVVVPLGAGKEFKHTVQTALVKIVGKPRMRMDMVKLGGTTSDVRFRAEFLEWSATLRIEYNPDVLDEQTVANLVYRAGLTVGVGEGRPEKGDQGWGQFEIVS